MATNLNPIYVFVLQDGNGNDRTVEPIWNDSLSLDIARESGQVFFRKKMQGSLVFVGEDADWINGKPFTTKFRVLVYRTDILDTEWVVEWNGSFCKTDCKIDFDNRKVTVQPAVDDQYIDILAGLDKEYNLIELLPQQRAVNMKKNPLIQIYGMGDDVLSCLHDGMSWQQDVTPTSDRSVLVGDYHFHELKMKLQAGATKDGSYFDMYQGVIPPQDDQGYYNAMMYGTGDTYLQIVHRRNEQEYETYYEVEVKINRLLDDATLYRYDYVGTSDLSMEGWYGNLSATALASGTVNVEMSVVYMYARILTDRDEFDSLPTAPIGSDDFCADNRNYKRVIGFNTGDRYIISSGAVTTDPTEYGKKDNTHYWAEPDVEDDVYPVGRSLWNLTSIWFVDSGNIMGVIRNNGRKTMTVKVCYPLSSVISVLLQKIAPSINHQPNTAFSQFLYGDRNPVSDDMRTTLMITPKTNITAGEYSLPAQKATITLGSVLDMLRDVFQCYWHIEGGRLIIEHISYYKRGGSYSTTPAIGTDLTSIYNTRNGKKFSMGQNTVSYDKSQMMERYEFAWMDEVTEPFTGQPIDILSPYIERGMVEEVNVSKFTTDIDYIMLNPQAVSKDGFALMAPLETQSSTPVTPPTVEIPEHIKTKTTSLLANFSSYITVPANGMTYNYLCGVIYECYAQYTSHQSAYGLPVLYNQSLWPSLTSYYGSATDATKAQDAMMGFAMAMVLTEIKAYYRNQIEQVGYNIGPDKNVYIYNYAFTSDQNICRLIGSVIYAAMRGLMQPDMPAMRTECGGSMLNLSIAQVATAPYTSYKDTYYVDIQNFMPTAPGPYYTGYTDRSSIGGVPYPNTQKESDNNLSEDLAIYNEAVSNYNLENPTYRQRVVQAIADKSGDVQHLFGVNRSDGTYSFHPVFGTDTIGMEIADNGATAAAVSKIFEVGIGARQPLKQGSYDGRMRPGQQPNTTQSKAGAAGVLLNYTIDNIDGTPVTEYGTEGEYNQAERGQVYANSYPSGHSSGIFATALFLIELLPLKADLIMKAANDFAVSRQICRYHWNSDTIVGRLSGAAIAPVMRASTDYASLLAAAREEIGGGSAGGALSLSDITLTRGTYPWVRHRTVMQNGMLAFCYLQPKYLLYDMPATSIRVNGMMTTASGVKRTKKQEVTMPCMQEQNPLELVKTGIGNGYVEKMKLSLTSRTSKTTLNYEP